jgi:hypothetical protein
MFSKARSVVGMLGLDSGDGHRCPHWVRRTPPWDMIPSEGGEDQHLLPRGNLLQ